MGIIRNGILGGVSGKVGTIVGARYRDSDTIRSLPKPSGAAPTEKQLAQYERFAMVGKFVKSIKDVIDLAYRNFPSRMSAANHISAHLLKNAITGVYPTQQLDYSKAIIASGKLPGGVNAAAAAAQPDGVRFQWNNNSGLGKAQPADRAILIVYCPEKDLVAYDFTSGTRADTFATLDVPMFTTKQVHTWLSFLSADGRDVANSVYTGSVLVS